MTESPTSLFVRGKYELARLEPGSKAKGRQLTEHEVREAYGSDVFAEIDEHLSAILLASVGAIEQALRQQREALGVTPGQLASAAGVPVATVKRAEQDADQVDLRELERLSWVLGLDPAKLSVDQRAGADPALGVRLRLLEGPDAPATGARLSPPSVLRFSEAASIIRAQLQLQRWLGAGDDAPHFEPSHDYGEHDHAWRAGYRLAEWTRQRLGLGLEPIESMRHLVEHRLGIPIIQVALPTRIAGATISSHGRRGIVLNTAGANSNVWIRRTTMAHELAHILFDPEQQLSNVRVDSYDEVARNAEHGAPSPDRVEQRANAFAVEFLAPREAVKKIVPSPAQVSTASIERVMSRFGIGRAAARFHVGNAWWGQAELPSDRDIRAEPTDEQRSAEDFTLDYFQPQSTPEQRRGRFAVLTAEAIDAGLITIDTGAQYLACSVDDLSGAMPFLRSLHPAHAYLGII